MASKDERKGPDSRPVHQRDIVGRLKRIYNDVTEEPIPDDFMRLLEEADTARSDSPDADQQMNDGAADGATAAAAMARANSDAGRGGAA